MLTFYGIEHPGTVDTHLAHCVCTYLPYSTGKAVVYSLSMGLSILALWIHILHTAYVRTYITVYFSWNIHNISIGYVHYRVIVCEYAYIFYLVHFSEYVYETVDS